MGGTSGDEEVDGDHRRDPAAHLGMGRKGPASDGARPGGDDHLRVGDRLPRFQEGFPHVGRHGSRHQDPVAVPGGRHELNPEAPEVPCGGFQDFDVKQGERSPILSRTSLSRHLEKQEGLGGQ